jgi:hypothetical protein
VEYFSVVINTFSFLFATVGNTVVTLALVSMSYCALKALSAAAAAGL